MEETKNIEQLLSQVKSISRSYERLNEANGGNFNIFSVLRIESDEVTTHSRFIAELLNPNGVHGFGDALSCKVYPEDYQGKVTGMPKPMGGSIDILIKEPNSDEHVIMIENKIYAGEQEHQLLRYHNAYPKGKLLFLTLWGYESNQESSKSVNYRPVSYEYHIINWLEECRKIAVSNPTLRETLTQYINLIKKLTNQNINTKMNKELAKLFTESKENYNALLTLNNLHYELYKKALETSLFPVLEDLQKSRKDYSFHYDKQGLIEKKGEWLGVFRITSEKMKTKNVCINFAFNCKSKANYLIGGFNYLSQEEKANHDYGKLRELFRETFKPLPTKETDGWPCFFDYWDHMHWENLGDLKNIIHGNFKEDLKEKVNKMIEIIDDSF